MKQEVVFAIIEVLYLVYFVYSVCFFAAGFYVIYYVQHTYTGYDPFGIIPNIYKCGSYIQEEIEEFGRNSEEQNNQDNK